MKHARISATFPELRGPYGFKIGHGEGSTAAIAIARAVNDLFEKIPHRRVSVIKATILITGKEPDEKAHAEKEEREVVAA